jgi:hypothetical protein
MDWDFSGQVSGFESLGALKSMASLRECVGFRSSRVSRDETPHSRQRLHRADLARSALVVPAAH